MDKHMGKMTLSAYRSTLGLDEMEAELRLAREEYKAAYTAMEMAALRVDAAELEIRNECYAQADAEGIEIISDTP